MKKSIYNWYIFTYISILYFCKTEFFFFCVFSFFSFFLCIHTLIFVLYKKNKNPRFENKKVTKNLKANRKHLNCVCACIHSLTINAGQYGTETSLSIYGVFYYWLNIKKKTLSKNVVQIVCSNVLFDLPMLTCFHHYFVPSLFPELLIKVYLYLSHDCLGCNLYKPFKPPQKTRDTPSVWWKKCSIS